MSNNAEDTVITLNQLYQAYYSDLQISASDFENNPYSPHESQIRGTFNFS